MKYMRVIEGKRDEVVALYCISLGGAFKYHTDFYIRAHTYNPIIKDFLNSSIIVVQLCTGNLLFLDRDVKVKPLPESTVHLE